MTSEHPRLSAALSGACAGVRIEVSDPRSDNGRRIVDIGPETVTIRRSVAGVPMAIRVALDDYRGVALRATGLQDGRFRYEVRLAHRDPDLGLPLFEGDDLEDAKATWRAWVADFGLPALAGRSEGTYAAVNLAGDNLVRRSPHERRRGASLIKRRPRFLKRRAMVHRTDASIVDADPVVLFYGWRPGR